MRISNIFALTALFAFVPTLLASPVSLAIAKEEEKVNAPEKTAAKTKDVKAPAKEAVKLAAAEKKKAEPVAVVKKEPKDVAKETKTVAKAVTKDAKPAPKSGKAAKEVTPAVKEDKVISKAPIAPAVTKPVTPVAKPTNAIAVLQLEILPLLTKLLTNLRILHQIQTNPAKRLAPSGNTKEQADAIQAAAQLSGKADDLSQTSNELNKLWLSTMKMATGGSSAETIKMNFRTELEEVVVKANGILKEIKEVLVPFKECDICRDLMKLPANTAAVEAVIKSEVPVPQLKSEITKVEEDLTEEAVKNRFQALAVPAVPVAKEKAEEKGVARNATTPAAQAPSAVTIAANAPAVAKSVSAVAQPNINSASLSATSGPAAVIIPAARSPPTALSTTSTVTTTSSTPAPTPSSVRSSNAAVAAGTSSLSTATGTSLSATTSTGTNTSSPTLRATSTIILTSSTSSSTITTSTLMTPITTSSSRTTSIISIPMVSKPNAATVTSRNSILATVATPAGSLQVNRPGHLANFGLAPDPSRVFGGAAVAPGTASNPVYNSLSNPVSPAAASSPLAAGVASNPAANSYSNAWSANSGSSSPTTHGTGDSKAPNTYADALQSQSQHIPVFAQPQSQSSSDNQAIPNMNGYGSGELSSTQSANLPMTSGSTANAVVAATIGSSDPLPDKLDRLVKLIVHEISPLQLKLQTDLQQLTFYQSHSHHVISMKPPSAADYENTAAVENLRSRIRSASSDVDKLLSSTLVTIYGLRGSVDDATTEAQVAATMKMFQDEKSAIWTEIGTLSGEVTAQVVGNELGSTIGNGNLK